VSGGAVMTVNVGARIEHARVAAGLSQRALAEVTGISQSTLSRVISGQRVAKVPELVAIGWATGVTMAELAGTGTVAERAEGAARATNHADMDGMREALLHFLELDDYLSGQAIPAIVLPGEERWLPRRKAACQLQSSAVIIISAYSR
jgi:transcriptional regulator with XRE-family HTH domain